MAEQSQQPANPYGERSTLERQGSARQESAQATSDVSTGVGAAGSPFADEAEVLRSRMVTEDDISATQSAPNAAAQVSAEHIGALIYPESYAEMSPTESRSPEVQQAIQEGSVARHDPHETVTDRGVSSPDADASKHTGDHE
ncbi:MAG: hypothetical protein ABI068_15720 [Ktedonobacterales bacterium]